MDEANTVKVSITLPKYLLNKIDNIAKQTYNSRSGVIRDAIQLSFVERRIDEDKTLAKINKNWLSDYLKQILD